MELDWGALGDLSREQQEMLYNALVSTFREGELRRLVQFGLGHDLDRIVSGDTYADRVASLVVWAVNNGRVGELVREAHEQSPNSPTLKAFLRDLEDSGNGQSYQLSEVLRGRLVMALMGLPEISNPATRNALLEGLPAKTVKRLPRDLENAANDFDGIVSYLARVRPANSDMPILSDMPLLRLVDAALLSGYNTRTEKKIRGSSTEAELHAIRREIEQSYMATRLNSAPAMPYMIGRNRGSIFGRIALVVTVAVLCVVVLVARSDFLNVVRVAPTPTVSLSPTIVPSPSKSRPVISIPTATPTLRRIPSRSTSTTPKSMIPVPDLLTPYTCSVVSHTTNPESRSLATSMGRTTCGSFSGYATPSQTRQTNTYPIWRAELSLAAAAT